MPSQKEWDKFYINSAIEVSNFSKARRLQVGAILVKDNRPLVNGFNGTAPKRPNNCEDEEVNLVDRHEPYWHKCDVLGVNGEIYKYLNYEKDYRRLVTKLEVLHAEENILVHCAKNGIPTNDSTIYISHNPCLHCVALLYSAGIKRIVYNEDYRDSGSIAYCNEVGIQIEKYKENNNE